MFTEFWGLPTLMNIIFLADNHILYIYIYIYIYIYVGFPSAAAIFMLKKISVGPIIFTKTTFSKVQSVKH